MVKGSTWNVSSLTLPGLLGSEWLSVVTGISGGGGREARAGSRQYGWARCWLVTLVPQAAAGTAGVQRRVWEYEVGTRGVQHRQELQHHMGFL